MAVALTERQLNQAGAAAGWPATAETRARVVRQIEHAAAEAARGFPNAIEQLRSPIARAEARRLFEQTGPAAGVTIVSGTTGIPQTGAM